MKVKARPAAAPKVGFVSLGCPKALVDSEGILTQLRAEGYDIAPSYEGSDLVVVNTCGFIDAAVQESLDAIGEALAANGKVIVTGCLGAKGDVVRQAHPKVLAVTGPPGLLTLYHEDFEQALSGWKIQGEPRPDGSQQTSGRRSLLLSAAGQEAVYSLAEPLAAGRLGLSFHDPGAAAGARWLAFRRGDIRVAVNLGTAPAAIPLGNRPARVLAAWQPVEAPAEDGLLHVPGESSVVLAQE